MAGIPPFAGFFGKFFIFLAAVKSGLYGLAVIGVLSSVVAAFYYLRIIKIIVNPLAVRFHHTTLPSHPHPFFQTRSHAAALAHR